MMQTPSQHDAFPRTYLNEGLDDIAEEEAGANTRIIELRSLNQSGHLIRNIAAGIQGDRKIRVSLSTSSLGPLTVGVKEAIVERG